MKLYIKRIAQAALITSAVAVAGSAFAMASTNVGAVPADTFSITLVNSDDLNAYYQWAFTENTKLNSTGNNVVNTNGQLSMGPVDINTPTRKLVGNINPNMFKRPGLMLCNFGTNPIDRDKWQDNCSISTLIDGDSYRVANAKGDATGSEVQLDDISKILDVYFTYENMQGAVIGNPSLVNGKLSPVTKDGNGILQLSTTADNSNNLDLPTAKNKINARYAHSSKPLDMSSAVEFESRFNTLTGKVKISVPTLSTGSIQCTPEIDKPTRSSYTYKQDSGGLMLTLDAAHSDNKYLNLNGETPIYQANIIYRCQPEGSA